MPTALRLACRLAALIAVALLSWPATALAGSPALDGGEAVLASAQSTAVLLVHGPRAARVVALTFDDGYSPRTCEALVDELVALQVPATFFPNAVYVRSAPELWRKVADLGFPIGNHTTSHPLMTQLSLDQQRSQIASDRAIVERVLGAPSLSVFRPPFGAWNGTTLRAAEAAGYPIVLNWDASFADSSRRRNGAPWPISSYVRSASSGTSGSVILGHCGSRIDVEALAAVVASYRSRGFTFVTVPELLGLPGAGPMRFPAPSPLPMPRDPRRAAI